MSGWVKHVDFILLDIITLQLSFIAAYFIRFKEWELPYADFWYQRAAMFVLLIQLGLAAFTAAYSGIIRRTFFKEIQHSFVHATLVFIGLNVYVVAFKRGEIYSRQFWYIYWAVAFVVLLITRTLLKRVVRRRILASKNGPVMIAIVSSRDAEQIVKDFKSDRFHEFKLRGFVFLDKAAAGESVMDIPVVSNIDDFYEYAQKNIIDEVFISNNNLDWAQLYAEELLKMGITVHYRLLRREDSAMTHVIENCGGYSVMTTSIRITTGPQLLVKRLVDIIGSIVGLVITAVCFVIFAPIIFIQSPGKIFFTQTRIGKNGRRFKLYKFRSMYPNAEEMRAQFEMANEMTGNMFKMKNDPRVIPIGRFMRKHSIDELPQFWNVLKGDMSLVGTRPPTIDEFEKYASHHKARLGFNPGITGLWQVSGRSDITDFEEVVELDTKYISEWSVWLDLKILLKTIKIVFSGKGAE